MKDMNVLINTFLVKLIGSIIIKEFGLIGTKYNFEFQMNKPCTYKFILVVHLLKLLGSCLK
jgi:hypothetical protein